MTSLSVISTYLPPWGPKAGARTPGEDEDAVTLAVEAGRPILEHAGPGAVQHVVWVTRDLPLLDGGNGAALLAGLGLPSDVELVERVGGAPALLDALLSARPHTLVLAADLAPAGAGAALVARSGLDLRPMGRTSRSLPVRTRSGDGIVHDYEDPRLLRERGVKASLDLALPQGTRPAVLAGVQERTARELSDGTPSALPTTGASSVVFALAAMVEQDRQGVLAASEHASLTAAEVSGGAGCAVLRYEPKAKPLPKTRRTPGPEIPISLPAYDRAFEPKLRWEAAACGTCGTLAYPPRHRCHDCGAEGNWKTTPLPRSGSVYTSVSVHVPVPGMTTPYDLAIVQLDGTDTRVLVRTTASEAGQAPIGATGRMTLRRVAVRSGVPDYGYAFWPDATAENEEFQ